MNPANKRWTPEACALVLQQWRAGITQTKLAETYGISQSRIGQVISKAELYERRAAKAAAPPNR